MNLLFSYDLLVWFASRKISLKTTDLAQKTGCRGMCYIQQNIVLLYVHPGSMLKVVL